MVNKIPMGRCGHSYAYTLAYFFCRFGKIILYSWCVHECISGSVAVPMNSLTD